MLYRAIRPRDAAAISGSGDADVNHLFTNSWIGFFIRTLRALIRSAVQGEIMTIGKIKNLTVDRIAPRTLLSKLAFLGLLTVLAPVIFEALLIRLAPDLSLAQVLMISLLFAAAAVVAFTMAAHKILAPLRQINEDLRLQAASLRVGNRSMDEASEIAVIVDSLQDQVAANQSDAETDVLTGLLNRRGFDRKRKALTACGVIFFDIDNFKSVNDTRGHAVGDWLLRRTAEVLRSVLRDGELVARFGGDEFVVLLPNASLEQCRKIADRVRCAVIECLADEGSPLTISAGVAAAGGPQDVDTALVRADLACYSGKRAGRNRVVCSNEARDVLVPAAAE